MSIVIDALSEEELCVTSHGSREYGYGNNVSNFMCYDMAKCFERDVLLKFTLPQLRIVVFSLVIDHMLLPPK